jgi:hypothetical protein
MDENLLDFYTEKLSETKNPGAILNSLYISLFELEYNTNLLPRFGKLCTIYGKQRVLQAMLDTYEMEKIDHIYYIRLLVYFIKKHLNDPVVENKIIDTKTIKKELNKKRKLKVKDLFIE